MKKSGELNNAVVFFFFLQRTHICLFLWFEARFCHLFLVFHQFSIGLNLESQRSTNLVKSHNPKLKKLKPKP